MRRLNLNGKKFGRLEVIDVVTSNPDYVVCRCECGNICTIKSYNLTKSYRPTRSCGCLRSEAGRRTITTNTIHNNPTNKMFGTLFNRIESKTVNKNNKTGHRGVFLVESTGKYRAYIGLRKKLYNLGTYKTIEEAIDARLEAEKEMYAPLIAQKNAYLAEYNV